MGRVLVNFSMEKMQLIRVRVSKKILPSSGSTVVLASYIYIGGVKVTVQKLLRLTRVQYLIVLVYIVQYGERDCIKNSYLK
jgi:hypothetical protein